MLSSTPIFFPTASQIRFPLHVERNDTVWNDQGARKRSGDVAARMARARVCMCVCEREGGGGGGGLAPGTMRSGQRRRKQIIAFQKATCLRSMKYFNYQTGSERRIRFLSFVLAGALFFLNTHARTHPTPPPTPHPRTHTHTLTRRFACERSGVDGHHLGRKVISMMMQQLFDCTDATVNADFLLPFKYDETSASKREISKCLAFDAKMSKYCE